LTSSGGHQSWHAPTLFYSRNAGTIYYLDDYADGAGISRADFELAAPNIVKTEIWEGKPSPIEIRLDSLGKPRYPKGPRHSYRCAGGLVIRWK
jgi:hypothetical protein